MNLLRIGVVGLLLSSLVACASTSLRFPDQTTKIDLTGKNILVVAEDNVSNDTATSKAFMAAVSDVAGSMKVLPAIPDDVKGITRAYANFGLYNQGKVDPANPKAVAVDVVLKLAARLGTFDTIVFASIEQGGSSRVPKTVGVDLYGAIYDVPGKRILAAVSDSGTVPESGMLSSVPLKGRDITDLLFKGTGK